MNDEETLSHLELLPAIPFRKIIKMLRPRELKSLRLASKTLRDRVEQDEKRLFKHWIFYSWEAAVFKPIEPEQLVRFSKEVKTVQGLQLIVMSSLSDTWLSCFKRLKNEHPELKDLRMMVHSISSIQVLVDFLPTIGDCLTDLHVGNCLSPVGLQDLNSGSLPVLKNLIFSGDLTNEQTSYLLGLVRHNLKKLGLNGMDLGQNFISKNCFFSSLEEFSVFNCSVSDKGIVQLLQSSRIKKLCFIFFDSTGEGFNVLEVYNPLLIKELLFEECPRLTDLGLLSIIKCCPQLNILSLHESGISGRIFSEISLNFAPQVVDLDLQACPNLSDEGLVEMLKKIGANIKVIKLNSMNITGEAFAHTNVMVAPKLEHLELIACKKMTDFGFFSLFAKLGHELRTLKVSSNTSISGECIAANFSFQAKLENLELASCPRISDLGLLAMLSKLGEHLKVLKVFSCQITGKKLVEITTKNPPILEVLDITYCSKVCDDGLNIILEKFGSNLKKLQLRRTSVTGEGFQDLSADLVLLEDLDLLGCPVTDTGLVTILNKMGKNLKNLGLGGTEVSGENLDDVSLESSVIEKLSLRDCKNLTDKGLWLILNKFGGEVKDLDVDGTSCASMGSMSKCEHSPQGGPGLNIMSMLGLE